MIEVHPATADRFDAVETVLAPKQAGAPACWCLTYRIPNPESKALGAAGRPGRLRRYAEEGTPPGVVAYVDGEPAGWCSVSPRSTYHRLMHSRTIPFADELDPWSIVCLVVRAGYRRQGVARAMLGAAVEYAREQGAPAIEAYPVDAAGGRVNGTLAYMGTTELFESAGFERVLETDSHSAGLRRWLMRLPL
ncbi:GNAT family N-acetyltransferase [Agromyces archimandritae]|uniref:GNAT family N-acetyltransferase n=1 Tax=Agromyces archimandritae TaxID=2781962 RepID=A0A975FLV2_9MICO|nr:GNAT family N-acetyltransferase [Agromyces archimandritae]QTX03853.1 GNAT family N-acetyltransferase [Agromyces archimandritae]